MYLFVFFWSAALSTLHANNEAADPLPFGVVFSCYMCAMMSGSTIFTLVPSFPGRATHILKTVSTGASICLLSSILLNNEALLFWGFCLFEACVGAYFPSIASLKGSLIQDGSRGKVYGILRLPLNVFVIVAHSLAAEGKSMLCYFCKPSLISCRGSTQEQRFPYMRRPSDCGVSCSSPIP